MYKTSLVDTWVSHETKCNITIPYMEGYHSWRKREREREKGRERERERERESERERGVGRGEGGKVKAHDLQGHGNIQNFQPNIIL